MIYFNYSTLDDALSEISHATLICGRRVTIRRFGSVWIVGEIDRPDLLARMSKAETPYDSEEIFKEFLMGVGYAKTKM